MTRRPENVLTLWEPRGTDQNNSVIEIEYQKNLSNILQGFKLFFEGIVNLINKAAIFLQNVYI